MAAAISSPPAMRACKSANTAATSASKRTCGVASVREADCCHASVLGVQLSPTHRACLTRTPLTSARVMSPGTSRTTLNGTPPPHNSYISGDQQQASKSNTTNALICGMWVSGRRWLPLTAPDQHHEWAPKSMAFRGTGLWAQRLASMRACMHAVSIRVCAGNWPACRPNEPALWGARRGRQGGGHHCQKLFTPAVSSINTSSCDVPWLGRARRCLRTSARTRAEAASMCRRTRCCQQSTRCSSCSSCSPRRCVCDGLHRRRALDARPARAVVPAELRARSHCRSLTWACS
jgi:hypothetical protein